MIKLRTLGECVVEIGRTRLGPDAERLFAVLLCLGLERERLVSRTALAELLWPDVPDERATHCLRQAVYRLRALGVPIRSDRSNLWLTPEGVDADCAPLLGQSPEPGELAERIGGTFLPGYNPRFSDRYAEWVERQRDLVNARIRRLFLAEIARLKSRGDWLAVECMAARCLAIDPLNEEATLARAEAAALQGGKAQALAILDGYLREVGPQAREIRLPATVLRRRIAEATNLDRPRAITETPFFGRASEMAELNRALQMAHGGSGSAYLFWGEPGIGKTRLTQEFNRAISLGHAQVIRVGCQSNDDRRPLSMFVDMLPRLLAMPGALGCAPSAMRYLRRLTEHDPKEPLSAMDPRDAATVYANVRRSILDLLDAVASEGLLVVTIEDVHWLDMGSWDVIADALPWLSTRRVLLVLTSREPDAERKRGIGELAGLQRHHLPPLDRTAVDALAATIVERSGKELAADVVEWCAQASGGNPYHLTELVLHGLREGQVAKLPASLSQLISERLARLHPLSLHVLQAVSVLGAQSTLDRLERLLDQRRVDLLESLDELERSGLIESEPSRLVAKHELLAQAAVQRMSVSARRLLHRHAARILERDGESSPAPVMQWACAEHWREAGEVGRALSYLQECARYALESGAPADALELLKRARSLARNNEDKRQLVEHEIGVLAYSGKWQTLTEVAERARGIGLQESDVDSHDDQELTRIEALWRVGSNYEEALRRLRSCAAANSAPADHRIRAATLCLICCDNMRNVVAAEEVHELISKTFHSHRVSQPDRDRFTAIYHASFGDVELGARAARSLSTLQTAADPIVRRARDSMLIGTALRTAGSEDEAFAAYQDTLELTRSRQMYALAGGAALALASLTHCQGLLDASEEWLEQAKTLATRAQDTTLWANILGVQTRRALLERDFDRLPSLFEMLDRAAPNPPRRYAIIAEAARIRYRIMLGDFEDAAAITSRLYCLHSEFASGIGGDYVIAAICEAHEVADTKDEIATLLERYISTQRRERSSFPPELRRFTLPHKSRVEKRSRVGS